MEIHSLSPETLQDTTSITAPTSIPADQIAATFSSNSIGRSARETLPLETRTLLTAFDETDLLSAPLGTKILAHSDEFFAAAENLINPKPPISRPGHFVHSGAWYDGWETRRHNPAPYDFVIFRLGVASGRVAGVEIDTAFFTGNHAPEVSVEGSFSADDKAVLDPAFAGWSTILPQTPCGPSRRHAWLLPAAARADAAPSYTHVRLRMYPDGGIARFRLYGAVVPVFPQAADATLDLAATVNGGVATSCSDQHFGVKDNLLLPGRGVDMGDGWETKRSRGVHVDWVVVRLGAPAEVQSVVVDTAHFRGNFPQKVQLFAAEEEEGGQAPAGDDHDRWVQILSPQPCGPDREHAFEKGALVDVAGKTYRYIKMVIIPDGGVKRLRVFGVRRV